MSKSIQAIVVCIIFTNSSIQKKLESNSNGSGIGSPTSQQQSKLMEEMKTGFIQGWLQVV